MHDLTFLGEMRTLKSHDFSYIFVAEVVRLRRGFHLRHDFTSLGAMRKPKSHDFSYELRSEALQNEPGESRQ